MSFYDNFSRPDNLTSPGALYLDVGTGTGEIASGLYRAFGNGVYSCSLVANAGFPASMVDQFAQCSVVSATFEGGPVVRGQASSFSCYNLLGRNDLLRIYRIDAGTFTQLLDLASSVANGDVLKLRAEGSLLVAYKNGVVMGSVTDTTYGAGYFGVLGIGNITHGVGWPCRDLWGGVAPGGDLWRRDGCNWH